MLKTWKFRLQAPEGDSTSGGEPTGNALANATDGATTTPPAASATTTAAKVELPANWKDALPDDLKNDPNLKTIYDVPNLAKSFINAQKAIGADKIPKPGKHATEEDWKNFYKQIGLPDAVDKYDLGLNTDELGFEKEFVGGFKEAALKANVLPAQAKAILEWYNGSAKAQMQAQAASHKAAITQQIEGLKTEWGDAFNQNVNVAKSMVLEFADPDLQKVFFETDLGNDPKMLKFLNKIAGTVNKEGVIHPAGTHLSGKLTPKDALEQMNQITQDLKSPYHDKEHPKHAEVMREVEKLAKSAFPGSAART